MYAGEPDAYVGFIGIAVVIALNLGIFYYLYRMQKAAELVCREVVDRHLPELKMLTDVTLSTTWRGKRGILALLNDRLLFIPFSKKEKSEYPLAQVSAIKTGGKAGNLLTRQPMRKLELSVGQQLLKFQISPYVYSAWVAALTQMSPMVAATSAMPIIK